MDTVFISHSKIDESHAKEIEELLRDGGYRAWIFQRDSQGGRPWQQQLPEEIEKCTIFLYIATANAQISVNCQREVQHAALKKKPLVTVTVEAGVIPPAPLDDHHRIYLNGSGNAVAQLMRALRIAEPLRWEIIPDEWKTWDGKTKLELTNAINKEQGTLPTSISRDLSVVEKRDILHEAVSHSQADFEKKLKELARSDPRIEFHIGHNSSSGFTSFVSIDGQLIKGCRVYISADFNGLTYDGNTYYAVQWEFDEIRRQMKEINRQISGNLQAVIDGDANVAAFVRSLDRQHEGLRKQLQERKSMLNQLGHMSGIQEGDNSYTLRTTVGKLDGKPVLEFLPAPEMTDESPDSRICTLEDAAERLWKAFVGDTISQPLSEP